MLPRSTPHWWLAVPVLLLAAWLGALGLDADAFSPDEISSMIVAGGAHYGPFTPAQAWQRVAENSPDQALGWALLLSVWGQVVGWSELATRTLPFFIGLLALAWVYRAGRDLFNPRAGLAAILVLGTSLLFVNYLHKLRVFTLIALVVSLTLWSYWRIMLHPRPAGWGARLAFVAGCIGLFYTHYFATPLLAAIGLYHLVFAPKTRRWWGPVLLGLVAVIAFVPEIQVLVVGLQKNLGNDDLQASAMSALEVVQSLLFFFSNGQVGLWLVLGVALVTVATRRRLKLWGRPLVYVVFTTLALLALMMIENEIVRVMAPGRVRYLMPLWPLLALLVGAGAAAVTVRRRWLGWALVGLWVLAGLWATFGSDLREQVDGQTPPWREVRTILQTQGSATGDVFVFHGLPTRTREFYGAATIPMRREIIETWNTPDDLEGFVNGVQRVWLGTDWRPAPGFPDDWSQDENYQRFQTLLAEEWLYCAQSVDHPVMRLVLYVRSTAFCPLDDPVMRFGDGIALTGVDVTQGPAGDLTLALGWAIDDSVPPETYSVAVHVLDAQTGNLVTQADFGLPPDPFAPVQITIPADDLPSDGYRVLVGVYAWQTGATLPGVDLREGATGDMLLLYAASPG